MTPPCGVPFVLRLTFGGRPSPCSSTTGVFSHIRISLITDPSATRLPTQANSCPCGIESKYPFRSAIVDRLIARLQMRANLFQGIMRRSSASESIATIQKIRFEDRLQDQERRHLDNAIPYARDSQWPQLPIRFLNPDPPYWFRPIRFLLQRLLDLIQKSLNST